MEYIVQPGDTLESIAKKELGDESLWQYLASINSITAPYTVVPGTTIRTDQFGVSKDKFSAIIVALIAAGALTAAYFIIKKIKEQSERSRKDNTKV